MVIKGVVSSSGNQVLLENGARLKFEASDCASPVKPGEPVLLDTEKSPSIRSAKGAAVFNPVTELKVSGVEETKALLRALGDEL